VSTTELLLIDLSSLAHPLFHMSASEPDPNWTSTQIVSRVRALSSSHPHCAICCDSGKSFRHDLAPRVALGDGKYAGYKADRPEKDARLQHQIALAVERLKADGYPVWSAENVEADDVIASATRQALAIDGATVLIATADKDLLQLVNDRVRVKNTAPNAGDAIRDEAAVVERFGVKPGQMLDYLCLVGDKSDNVKGAKGIGEVIARDLLTRHGSLAKVYELMDQGIVQGITPTMRTNLMEFRTRWALTRELIALRDDVDVPMHEIAAERTAVAMEDEPVSEHLSDPETVSMREAQPRELTAQQSIDALGAATANATARVKANGNGGGEIVASQGTQTPVDYSQQLEPRTMTEAIQLAQRMYDSRLFSAYGTPQAVLATVLAGRELGIPAMAALRAFHIIEGKPQLSAGAIQSLVLKSGRARYFRCTERTPTRATFCTQRGDDPEICLSYSIEEGRAAFVGDDAKWAKSGWGRNPADMLVARASSKLARLVYPDVVSGLYAPEEFD
jgi:5'-3' exonuclease